MEKEIMKPIAIFSSDSNPAYSEFAPLVHEMWNALGFEPVYIKIGEGDFPAIPGIETSLQAQIVRFYAPKLFPDRVVITTDIDMLPFDRNYYWSKLPTSENQISIYSADAWADSSRYPMCYLAAYGKTFEKIALDNPNETWEEFVRRLHSLGHGWNTDEIYITKQIKESSVEKIFYTRGWKSNGVAQNRLCRVDWRWDEAVKYYDAHCPRPYSAHKEEIDSLKYFLTTN